MVAQFKNQCKSHLERERKHSQKKILINLYLSNLLFHEYTLIPTIDMPKKEAMKYSTFGMLPSHSMKSTI